MRAVSNDGPARLAIVIPVAIGSFFYLSIIEYALPLFFSALSEAASAKGEMYPRDIWSTLTVYKVTPFVIGPTLSGLLARRYGERMVWCYSLLGQAIVPVMLILDPDPVMIRLLALWMGFTGALMWAAGISLVQMVPPEKKGLSNGWMMASTGIGSLAGPIVGRLLLLGGELKDLVADGRSSDAWGRMFGFQQTETIQKVTDFDSIFWLLTTTTVISAILVGLWGQRPGRFDQHDRRDWSRTVKDLGLLFKNDKFWGIVIPLSFLGGPIFQSVNQFLPFRAEDLGLKDGSRDNGWIWLQFLKTLMWLIGGAGVGLLAGRRAPGIAVVLVLGSFGLAAFSIGGASVGWHLFLSVAAFEFVRQFMRWSQTGYLSEHLPAELRPTAIGVAITFSGIGAATFGWCAGLAWDPVQQSSSALYFASALSIVGVTGLFIYDRLRPIRDDRET